YDYESVVGKENALVPCPCCGACSLDARGDYGICRVCWWEDDGQDNENADKVMGGPNYHLSLTQGRINFLKSGISDPARTDLCEHQEPIHKYSQGRVFLLSADGQTVLEPDANWEGTVSTGNAS
ncbi:MAG: CPCC family cysteine-rich protein, partial [Planctomycetota bacterium]